MSATKYPDFTGSDLSRLQAFEVVDLLKRKEVFPKDLLDVSFDRIEAVGPSINATPTVCRERAYGAAKAVDATQAGHCGWLAGLPIGIKDLTPVSGVRTTYGTMGFSDHIPAESDLLVERLEARGGLVVGKTNTPEFGAGANTFNDVFGPTRNPWNTSLNAGGSSGGAAASLATGETWLSHGSDHGGSLRTPAAFCGIVGLRPSPGRVSGGSRDNAFMIEGAQGPMARSVRDCALFLDAMAGFDPRFPTSFPAPDGSFQDAVHCADGKLRIAFTPDLNGFAPVDGEVEDHLRGVLALMEGQGVRTIGGQNFADYLGWLRFAYLATVTGLPAISVPVGLGPRGLPVGLQLIGKPRGEAALLAAARAVEIAVGGPLGPIDPVVTHGERVVG